MDLLHSCENVFNILLGLCEAHLGDLRHFLSFEWKIEEQVEEWDRLSAAMSSAIGGPLAGLNSRGPIR